MDANEVIVDPNTPPVPAPGPAVGAPAPAPVPEPVEEGDEGQVDANGQPVQARKPIQPRINELTRARHNAEREAAYWRGVAEASLGNKSSAAPTPAPAATPPKPTKDQFQTYDDYVEALTDWKTDRKMEVALQKVNTDIEQRSSKQTASQQEAERQTNWMTRQEAIVKALPDYHEVVGNAEVPIATHVADLLLSSEFGPSIAYKMAKDPAIAERLNKMTPSVAAMAIGRLEAAFVAEAPAPGDSSNAPAPSAAPAAAPAVPAKLSKAPAPPNTLNGNRGASTTPDLGKLPMDEYVKTRKAQGASWGRG